MRAAIDFVRGAVSLKDAVPVLTHFAFHDGKVQGFNGRLSISSPFPSKDLSLTVPADRFLSALDANVGDIKLSLKDDRLHLKAGKFSARLPIGAIIDFPLSTPDPNPRKLKRGRLLEILKLMRPFIGDDASRPFCNGILFRGKYAYATNNVILIRVPLDFPLTKATCNVPSFAVDELLRLNIEPYAIAESDSTLTFDLGKDLWLRTSLFNATWPKDPDQLLEMEAKKGEKFGLVPKSLLDAVLRISPLCPDLKNPVIRFEADGSLRTLQGPVEAEIAAGRAPGFEVSAFRSEPLALALGIASEIAWNSAPRLRFKGHGGVLGILIGVIP